MNKREFLRTSALLGAGLAAGVANISRGATPGGFTYNASGLNQAGEYVLPALPYAYNALVVHQFRSNNIFETRLRIRE